MVKIASLGSGLIQDWLQAVTWKVWGDAEGLRRNSGIDKTPWDSYPVHLGDIISLNIFSQFS